MQLYDTKVLDTYKQQKMSSTHKAISSIITRPAANEYFSTIGQIIPWVGLKRCAIRNLLLITIVICTVAERNKSYYESLNRTPNLNSMVA